MALVCLNLYYYRTDRAERLVLIKATPMQVEKVANTLDIDVMTFVSGCYPLEVNEATRKILQSTLLSKPYLAFRIKLVDEDAYPVDLCKC